MPTVAISAARKQRLRQLVWPREHGAWGMLFIPLLTGLFTGVFAGGQWFPGVLLAVAAFFLFCLRTPVESLLGTQPLKATSSERSYVRRYVVAFSAASLAPLVLLFATGHHLLLAFGAAAALLFGLQALARKRRSLRSASQVIGAAGLALTAPAAYYVVSGAYGLSALLLWIANVLFATNQIQYVHLRIEGAKLSRFHDKFEHGRSFLASQLASLTVLAILVLARIAPAMLLLAFIPAIARGTWWFFSGAEPLRVKRLGLSELAQAAVFGLLLVVAFSTT